MIASPFNSLIPVFPSAIAATALMLGSLSFSKSSNEAITVAFLKQPDG